MRKRGVSGAIILILVISIVIIAFFVFYNFGNIVNEKSLEAENINQITEKVVQDYSDCEPYIVKNYTAYHCYKYSSLQCYYGTSPGGGTDFGSYCADQKKIAAEACQSATDKCKQFFDSLDCPGLMEALGINHYAMPSFPTPGHDCSALVPDTWCKCTNLISSNYFTAGTQSSYDYVYWGINSVFGDYNSAKAECTSPALINYQCRIECPECHCCKNNVETHMVHGTPAGPCYMCDGNGYKVLDETNCKLRLFADRGSQQDLVVFNDNNPIPIGNKDNPDYYLLYLGKDDKLGCSKADLSWVEDNDIAKVWLESDGKKIAEELNPEFIAGSYIFQDSDLYKDNNPTLPRGKKITCKIQANVDGTTKTYESYDLIIIERNLKDETKFSENDSFILTQSDWKSIFKTIPALMWKNSSNDNWCQKLKAIDGEGNIIEKEKCGYPLLIRDANDIEKDSVFGKNEIKDEFVTEYKIDEFFKDNSFLHKKQIDGMFAQSAWKEKGLIVIVPVNVSTESYKASLIASQLAEYLEDGAPVFFVGSDNEHEWRGLLKDKLVIIVGEIGEDNQQRFSEIASKNIILTRAGNGFQAGGQGDIPVMSIEDAQDFMKTKFSVASNKLIIVNPRDIQEGYCEDGEYCKMSVFAPILGFSGDEKIEFVETEPAPGAIEMERLHLELYDEEMKDEPNEGTIEQIENDINEIEEQVIDRAEEVHTRVNELVEQNYMASLPDSSITFVAGKKAIPERLPVFEIYESFDKLYTDRDGNLDCCEGQEDQCCDCEVSPDIAYSRINGNLDPVSAAIASIVFSKPDECAGIQLPDSLPFTTNGWAHINYLGGVIYDFKTTEVNLPIRIGNAIVAVTNIPYYITKWDYLHKTYASPLPPLSSIFASTQFPNPAFQKTLDLEKFYHDEPYTKVNLSVGKLSCALKEKRIEVKIDVFGGSMNTEVITPELTDEVFAIAHYYEIMNQFKLGLMSAIEYIGAADMLIERQQPLSDININEKVAGLLPEVQETYNYIKLKAGLETDIPVMQERLDATQNALVNLKETDDFEKNLNIAIRQEKFLSLMEVSMKLNTSVNIKNLDLSMRVLLFNCYPDESASVFMGLKKIVDCINSARNEIDARGRQIRSLNPWIEGSVFKDVYGGKPEDRENIKNALTAQSNADRDLAKEYIDKAQAAIICIHSTGQDYNTCKIKVNEALKRSLPSVTYRANPNYDDVWPILDEKDQTLFSKYMLADNYLVRAVQDYQDIAKYNMIANSLVTSEIAIALTIAPIGLTAVSATLGAAGAIAAAEGVHSIGGLAITGANYAFLAYGGFETIDICAGSLLGNGNPRFPFGYLQRDNPNLNLGPDAVRDYRGCVQSLIYNVGVPLVIHYGIARPLFRLSESLDYKLFLRRQQKVAGRVSVAQVLAARAGGCFMPGTKIKMADGTEKNIENIKEGEKVIAYDIENNLPVEAKVTTTFVRQSDGYLIIEYEVEE